MIFNSFTFFYFFLIFYSIYWLILNNNLKLQNLFLLVSSYIFYGFWNYKFLLLIMISTIVDYYAGIYIYNSKTKKKKLGLLISIIVNIGILAVFKYYNFFIDSLNQLIHFLFKTEINSWTLNIILPVGISFYTFQTISYSIDIYNNKLKPTRNFLSFATFVAFFPQLVAGPIERAKNLLPQILQKRTFSYNDSIVGLRLILWGLFKKIVIADGCAPIVDAIFADYQIMQGSTLFIGLILFSFQIYCDFSGYSDIAIGISKLLGINLKINFKMPYFSRNIGEFWKRWHISLSTWFRDYLYIPIGGSRGSVSFTLRNIFVIFLVSGFWHGANFTFIIWGLCHALLYVPFFLLGTNRKYISDVVAQNTFFPNITEFFQVIYTYFAVVLAWVFFRAESLSVAFEYLNQIFSLSLFNSPINDLINFSSGNNNKALAVILVLFVFAEWFMRKSVYPLTFNDSTIANKLSWVIYYLIIILILLYGGSSQDFIYFQF